MKIKLAFFFIISIYSKSFSQFRILDSISDKKISDISLHDGYVYYGTDEGKFMKYKLKNKESEQIYKNGDSINDLNTNKDYIVIASNNKLIIKDLIRKKDTIITDSDKIIVSTTYKDDIYYGGKSGILYKYDALKEKNTEVLRTIDDKIIYSITSITIFPELDKIYICAGNLYSLKLSNYKSLEIKRDNLKDYYISEKLDNYLFVSNVKSNSVSFFEKNKRREIYDSFSTVLLPINNSSILLSSNAKTFLYDFKKKESIQNLSDNYALNAHFINDTLTINYGNKIIVYEECKKIELKTSIIFKPQSFVDYKNPLLFETFLEKLKSLYIRNNDKIYSININGFSDGTDENLKTLSFERAKHIKDLLSKYFPEKILIAKGFGGISNKNQSNTWKNSKVTFEIVVKNKYYLDVLNDAKSFGL